MGLFTPDILNTQLQFWKWSSSDVRWRQFLLNTRPVNAEGSFLLLQLSDNSTLTSANVPAASLSPTSTPWSPKSDRDPKEMSCSI